MLHRVPERGQAGDERDLRAVGAGARRADLLLVPGRARRHRGRARDGRPRADDGGATGLARRAHACASTRGAASSSPRARCRRRTSCGGAACARAPSASTSSVTPATASAACSTAPSHEPSARRRAPRCTQPAPDRAHQVRDHRDASPSSPPCASRASAASWMRALRASSRTSRSGRWWCAPRPRGRCAPRGAGATRCSWSPARATWSEPSRATALLARMMFEAGAREVWPGIYGVPNVIRSIDEVRAIEDVPPDSRLFSFITTHLFGGRADGHRSAHERRRPRLRVRTRRRGLYVVDSSVFPDEPRREPAALHHGHEPPGGDAHRGGVPLPQRSLRAPFAHWTVVVGGEGRRWGWIRASLGHEGGSRPFGDARVAGGGGRPLCGRGSRRSWRRSSLRHGEYA